MQNPRCTKSADEFNSSGCICDCLQNGPFCSKRPILLSGGVAANRRKSDSDAVDSSVTMCRAVIRGSRLRFAAAADCTAFSMHLSYLIGSIPKILRTPTMVPRTAPRTHAQLCADAPCCYNNRTGAIFPSPADGSGYLRSVRYETNHHLIIRYEPSRSTRRIRILRAQPIRGCGRSVPRRSCHNPYSRS